MTLLEISQLNILIWVLFGLIIGSVVHLFDPGDVRGGIFATLGLGILGSVIGGLFATFIFQRAVSGLTFQDIIITVAGGLLLAVLYRLTFRDKNHIRTINMKL